MPSGANIAKFRPNPLPPIGSRIRSAPLRNRWFARLSGGGRSHERTRLESEFRSSQKSDFQRLLDDSGIVKRGFARKSRPLFAAGRPAYSLLSSCFDRVLRAKVFAPAGLRHFFTVYQKKGPTKLAWLIANAKEFSHRRAALGLLYSYNCDANRRSHREIEFPVPVSAWLMHVFGGVSLSITYLITGMIVKVHGQHRLQSVLMPRV